MLYTVGMAIWFYVRYRSKWNIPRKTEMTLGVVLILAAIAIVIKIFPGPDFNLKNTDYTMLTRIQEKIWKSTIWRQILPCFPTGEWTGGIVS